ncbi:FAD-dependent oxidoreductase, partial [Bacillus cereus]|uniref:FAD-dependent oxidoreductase n=1 Tax=Bacillus cereus TaxID=1396 RepID=UPI00201BA018
MHSTVNVQKHKNHYSIALANGESIETDYVVLALPNEAVQGLLQDESLNRYFDQFTTASAITIYLGFDVPDSKLPADGTGYIVSHNSDVTCN